MTKAIPEGFHSVTPSMILKDSKKAIEFYKKAFGAKEHHVMINPLGKVAHAQIQIGNSNIMMADEMPQMPGCASAETLKGSPITLWIYTENVDALFNQAVKAGATVKMPPQDMFWGDRFGALTDPFGFQWSLATHKEDPSPEEMKKRSEKFFADMACAGKK